MIIHVAISVHARSASNGVDVLRVTSMAKKCSKEKRRRRVLKLAGAMDISDSALAYVLGSESDDPLTRRQIERQLDSEWKQIGTDTKLELKCGGEHTWSHCRLDWLLAYFCNNCPRFQSVLAIAIATFGVALSLVFYSDEVTAGNPLRPDNGRKYHAFYISFLEFGPAALSDDSLWLPVATLRSKVCSNVIGGLASVMRIMMSSWFVDPLQAHCGIMLCLPVPVLCMIRMGRVAADADALRGLLSLKGTSGIRPCPCCRNVLKKGNRAARAAASYFVDITSTAFDKFDLCEDGDFYVGQHLLSHFNMVGTRKAFKQAEKALGQVHNALSVFSDAVGGGIVRELMLTLDWMHIFFVGGLYNLLGGTLLKACKKCLKIDFSHILTFMSVWEMPRSTGGVSKAAGMFTQGRKRAMDRATGLKGSATELITTMPLLRRFLELFVVNKGTPRLNSIVAVFLCLCTLIDTIMDCKRQRYPTKQDGADAMRAATETFMTMYVLILGTSGITPKWHLLWHLWVQFLRDGFVLDCFATERKHKSTKGFANTIKKLHQFDKGVTLRAVLDQRRHLQEFRPEPYLVKRKLHACNITIAIRDLVIIPFRGVYLVQDVVEADGDLGLVCIGLAIVRKESVTCTKFRKCGESNVRVTDDTVIISPHAWSFDGDSVFVLHSDFVGKQLR